MRDQRDITFHASRFTACQPPEFPKNPFLQHGLGQGEYIIYIVAGAEGDAL